MSSKIIPENKPLSTKVFDYIIYAACIIMVALHLLYAYTSFMISIRFLNLHLGFALFISLLSSARDTAASWKRIVFSILAAGVVFCCIYVHIFYEELQVRAWTNTDMDIFVGLLLIVCALVATKLGFGWFMTLLIIGITLYPFVGKYLPEPFTTRAYPFRATVSNLSIGLTTGLYSNNLRTSAEYIFLFVIFGSLLSATGVQKFFWELGKILFRKLPSGTGLMAVLNSALVGSVTGSAVANVMITGVYTIPAMKNAGYKPEQAGAMEAAASTGGQIMPPVMGIIAFVMASYTGIPYIRIATMAIIPALLYFLCVGIYGHFSCMKNLENISNIEFFKEKVDYRVFFWKMPGFVLPLALVIILLSKNFSVMNTAMWAILCIIVTSLIVPKDLRPKFKDYIDGLVEGTKEAANLGVILSTVGMILITFSGSGLAVKLAGGIEKFSGGTMLGVLLIVWIMSILFGMIGVSSAAYYMSATFAATILINHGLTKETTHFFLMFPTVFSVVTPPVAIAAIVASKVADSNYLKTAWETVRASFVGFLLPFLVVIAPAILLQKSASTAEFWVEVLACTVFIFDAQIANVGFFRKSLNWPERAVLALAAIALVVWMILRIHVLIIAAFVATVIIIVRASIKKKATPLAA